MKRDPAGQALFNAVAVATPSYAGMFANVREGAAQPRKCETNPMATTPPERPAPAPPSGSSARKGSCAAAVAAGGIGRAGMCGDVRKRAAKTGNGETNPSPPGAVLPPQRVAAARLLALGRCGRAVAAEVGVNEHTITRWRRTPTFAAEVARQHELILAEQVRQRRAEKVDAFAAGADRVARKYGMVR